MLFLAAFLLRLFFAATGNPALSGDETLYDRIAVSLASGGGYSLDGVPTAIKCPGYPVFLASIYSVFGHNFTIVRIAQAAADALTCVAIYLIAKSLFDRKAAVVAGIICAAHYFFLCSVRILRPETLLMLFLALSILCWMKWKSELSARYIALAAVFSSVAVMLKPFMAAFPVMMLAAELPGLIKDNRIGAKKIVMAAVLFGVVFIVPIIPWAVRNFTVFRAPVVFSTDGGISLYASYNPPEGKKFGIIPNDAVTAESQKQGSEVEKDRFMSKKAMEYITSHPADVIKLIPLKMLFFWSLFDWETIGDGKGCYNFSTAFILPFALLGAVMLRRGLRKYTVIVLPVLFFFLFVGVGFQGLPRYRMIIEPYLIIFAAFALVKLFEKYPRKVVAPTASCWFALNVALYLYSDCALGVGRALAKAIKLW